MTTRKTMEPEEGLYHQITQIARRGYSQGLLASTVIKVVADLQEWWGLWLARHVYCACG